MIIIGLGNPGKSYEGTRHNIGFMVLNRLAHDLSCEKWKKEKNVSVATYKGHLLVEPWLFMNESGPAVRAWLAYRHLLDTDGHQIIVVHDDLDFPLGEVREQFDRSAGGHQGIQSIIDALGTQAFRRIRIGIGNNHDVQLPAETYVLQPFSASEIPIIQDAIQKTASLLELTLKKE